MVPHIPFEPSYYLPWQFPWPTVGQPILKQPISLPYLPLQLWIPEGSPPFFGPFLQQSTASRA
jgi:hypothetical protein